MAKDEPKNTWDQEFINDISERVYRYKLDKDNPIMEISGVKTTAVDRMLEKDADGGVMLRNRAVSFYGQVTRGYLAAFGVEPQKPNDRFELGSGEIIKRLTEEHRGTRGKPL